MQRSQLDRRLTQTIRLMQAGECMTAEIRNGTGLPLISIDVVDGEIRVSQRMGRLHGSGNYYPMDDHGVMMAFSWIQSSLNKFATVSTFHTSVLTWSSERRYKYINEFELIEDNATVEVA